MTELAPHEYYQCDYCGCDVHPDEATIKKYPGVEGTIHIPLCGECHE